MSWTRHNDDDDDEDTDSFTLNKLTVCFHD
jgi:hypothetical protein